MIDAFPFDKATQDIVNSIAILVIVLDDKGKILFFNKSCEHLTGYEFPQVKGHYLWERLLRPDSVAETKMLFENLGPRQMPEKSSTYWLDDQGKSHLILWSNSIVKNTKSDRVNIVGMGIDMSESILRTDLLEERREKLKAIFESSTDGIVIADEKGEIQQVNSAAAEMFGYSFAELVGQNVKILMPEPERSHHDGYMKRYAKTGEKRIIGIGREVIGQHKDQSLFPLYLSITEIFFDHTHSFVALMHNLTDRNKYLEDLRQAQKMEALGQLTGGLAHDFNNLLTVILGNLEMLYNHVKNEEGQELLKDALASVDLGTQLIERLLTFGRRQALEPKVININKVLSDMMTFLPRLIGDHIEIEKSMKEDIWPINADPSLVENAILNLLLNSKDALPDGGKIILKTTNYDNRFLQKNNISDLKKEAYVKISVIDNGQGIAPQILDRVYEPFFTTKTKGEGTGLGLGMVYGFVKQSGGTVKISSQLGEGTTVDLYLPKAKQDLPSRKTVNVKKFLMNGRGEIILYVEDDPKVRRINARRLSALGYIVHTAWDGPSAMDVMAKRGHIDLLFSDVVMPGGMLGKELGDYARKQQPDIKVLLTTGYADQVYSRDYAGENVLQKPYSKEVLAARLRQVLGD